MNSRTTELLYRLVDFGLAKGLIEAEDKAYTMNQLMAIMEMDAPEAIEYAAEAVPETATRYLAGLCDIAVAQGIIQDSGERRDLFCTKLMGALTPHPAIVRNKFFALLNGKGATAATEYFYQLCRDTDYIRMDRIARNARFFQDTPAGNLEITINLSKPEKDPKDIAAQRAQKQTGYPKCMLCIENPGYAGRIGFPARQNHRAIPLTLGGRPWHMQYSPYLYYNEHCIVFNDEHVPMKISHDTFVRLFDFIEQFPHYFLGSNADLPIVGGSILSHDHFQGGNYRFPMDKAGVRIALKAPIDGVEACIADWPMTCVRLKGADREKLTVLADELLAAWREYSDAECGIFAETDAKHNTVTPILRREDDMWKLDLVLRNNRTSPEHPLGIFHPHQQLHHIKKENIGLIEVMGLFILPGRLLKELAALEGYLTGEIALAEKPAEDSPIAKHYEWILEIASRTGAALTREQAQAAIRRELGMKCAQVLADAGVYKQDARGDEGILRFMHSIGYCRAE